MHAWWSAMRSLGVAVVVVYCCGLWLPVDAGGYHCTGTTGRGNQLFKCTALDNRNSTDSNRTVIDYTGNQTGPDVTIDEARTLLVNLKIQNLSTIHMLVINYVHGSAELENKSYRLVKPVIIKIKLANPRESYDLRFINYVNGGPTEEVISKETRNNYAGCDSGKLHPTCGIQYDSYDTPIPFSEGFCCSCIDSINAARQPRISDQTAVTDVLKTPEKNVQPRGEQDCTNISSSPANVNPFTYHESSHCFRFSDLWFNVYVIEKSQTFLPLTMELFEKNKDMHYVIRRVERWSTEKPWSGDTKPMQVSDSGSVSYQYDIKCSNDSTTNNLTSMYVLIPHKLSLTDDQSGKYLVIDSSWISRYGGTQCDKIGVQPQAFYEQPDRCYQPRGTCLGGRQPVQLLQEAKHRTAGQRMFVEDYIPGGKIRFDEVSKQLIVDHSASHVSASYEEVARSIQIEENTFINDKVMLQITEIHAIYDNEPDTAIEVRVYVTNLGLISAEFSAIICGQPKSNPKSVAHPQQTVIIYLSFECSNTRCDGKVDLYDADAPNDIQDAVASRKFGATRGSRCYCSWHRRCLCHDNGGGGDDNSGRLFAKSRSGGRVLSQPEYGLAGFQGDTPPGLTYAQIADGDELVLAASLELMAAYVAIALSLGLVKAVWPRYRCHYLWMVTSNWLYEMRAYREPELRPCQLVRDAGGYYVHPVTRSRNIRLTDDGQQFVVNVLFFFVLPTAYFLYRHRTSSAVYRGPSTDSRSHSYRTATRVSGCSDRHESASAGCRVPSDRPRHSANERNASESEKCST